MDASSMLLSYSPTVIDPIKSMEHTFHLAVTSPQVELPLLYLYIIIVLVRTLIQNNYMSRMLLCHFFSVTLTAS